MTLLPAIYRLATSVVSPLVPVLLRRRLKRGKEDAARIGERLGVPSLPRPKGPLVWLHGASVGETVSALPLVPHLQAMGLSVLMTSGTVTSAEIAAQKLPKGAIHQFVPIDTPKAAKAFIDHWRPDITLFVESEIWPNLLREAARPGAVLGIVNGRMSEKSYATWQRLSGLSGPLMRRFDLCLAQTEPDAQRYRALGAGVARNVGNLKFDAAILPVDAAELDALRASTRGRPVWIAASTHPGEDESFILAHRLLRERFPGALLIIVPRHPVRGADIAAMARKSGVATARRTAHEPLSQETAIYIADTLGELGLFYRLADIAFVGGTFAPVGGHNPIEPAKLDLPILHGPQVFNATEIYAAFDAAGGAELVEDGDVLARRLGDLLADDAALDILRAQSRATAEALGGALAATLEALRPTADKLRGQTT